MHVAIELMWPGVPVTDCAIMFPAGSNTPADRSSDSRTIVVNDVRISAVACSLQIEIRRFQNTSSTIASSSGAALTVMRHPDDEVRELVDRSDGRRPEHGGRLAFLDDRRPRDR